MQDTEFTISATEQIFMLLPIEELSQIRKKIFLKQKK